MQPRHAKALWNGDAHHVSSGLDAIRTPSSTFNWRPCDRVTTESFSLETGGHRNYVRFQRRTPQQAVYSHGEKESVKPLVVLPYMELGVEDTEEDHRGRPKESSGRLKEH